MSASTRPNRFTGARSTGYSHVADLVQRGEWTTYGEISAAVHGGSKRRARQVARAAATEIGFPNAHRVLSHDGKVVRGHDDVACGRRALKRLAGEGVEFDDRGRADPSRRIFWDELARRAGTRARAGFQYPSD